MRPVFRSVFGSADSITCVTVSTAFDARFRFTLRVSAAGDAGGMEGRTGAGSDRAGSDGAGRTEEGRTGAATTGEGRTGE